MYNAEILFKGVCCSQLHHSSFDCNQHNRLQQANIAKLNSEYVRHENQASNCNSHLRVASSFQARQITSCRKEARMLQMPTLFKGEALGCSGFQRTWHSPGSQLPAHSTRMSPQRPRLFDVAASHATTIKSITVQIHIQIKQPTSLYEHIHIEDP